MTSGERMIEQIGDLAGRPVHAVTIAGGGLQARVLSYGARLGELWVPAPDGNLADIVLGHASFDGYLHRDAYLGATCGRFGNRIAHGRFMLDGRIWELASNENGHHLHGGTVGFDRKIWRIEDVGTDSVTFSYLSRDGEMGYPGACETRVRYSLESGPVLRIEMSASATAPSPVNIVHHSYFNLAGRDSASILDHEVMIFADHYLPVDDRLIPTGEIRPVAGSAWDFRTLRRLGDAIGALPGDSGFDHNWCLNGAPEAWKTCAAARDPVSKRALVLRTRQPGVQFYTGGYLGPAMTGKAGRPMSPFEGFTLETQGFPNAPNEAGFPSTILRPGERYQHEMEFTFPQNAETWRIGERTPAR